MLHWQQHNFLQGDSLQGFVAEQQSSWPSGLGSFSVDNITKQGTTAPHTYSLGRGVHSNVWMCTFRRSLTNTCTSNDGRQMSNWHSNLLWEEEDEVEEDEEEKEGGNEWPTLKWPLMNQWHGNSKALFPSYFHKREWRTQTSVTNAKTLIIKAGENQTKATFQNINSDALPVLGGWELNDTELPAGENYITT